MKTNILLLFCLVSCVLNAQTATEKNVTWNFPVNPGTPKWKELKSYEEQLSAYNIPEEMMKKISTPELVKVCLAYPEWGVINAFNDRRIGLNNMMSRFNGFRELFARNDAAKELIKIYSKLDPLAIGNDWTLLQKGNYGFHINCIELLLSHGMMLAKLDEQDTRTLLEDVILKYNSKKRLPDVYSLWDLSPTAGLCLCIFDRDGKSSKNDAKLLLLKRTFMSEDIEVLNKVFESIKK
ncbi:MAG: hypothetical protein LBL58_04065 [Tannerellaceae bacterium]|jgi:hypothetical protein|nr:hypothetical protein [Tannerellaceae bacterium]